MLKREIKYEDFDGNEVVGTFYFNLSKTEIIELEVKYEQGLAGFLQRIIDTKDKQKLWAQFKELVLLSYGEKSEDGKRFVKNDELREGFSQTGAYDALFVEFMTDENAAPDFFKGILPKDIQKELEKDEKDGKAQKSSSTPPIPPTT